MRHVVDAIAAQGRNGDDELLHISRRELRDLKTIGDAIGIKTTVNPKTGIHEAFNWGKMLATGAGGAVGFVASGFNPLGAAAGAALASGAYTAAEGGNTQQILMNSAISGATAYAGAGIAQGLGEAGAAAAEPGAEVVKSGATQATTDATTSAATDTGVKALTNNAVQDIATVDAGAGTTTLPSGQVLQTPAQNVGPFTGGEPGAAPKFTGADIVKGFQNTSGKDLLSQYGTTALKTGVGLATLGAMPSNYNTNTSTTSSTGSNVRAETYVTPDGQRRTRIVGMADGGLASIPADAESAPDAQGMAVGGLTSMARGRYLQGPGDGVSDSIEAEIDGGQPARLATGEFVVPARAVSELGNGSSEAGAKQLHAMMDRIQAKRKSGKGLAYQANPRKLLPA